MKPSLSVVVIVLMGCAWQSAGAQTLSDDIPDASGGAYRWPAPTKPWELNPPLAELPHGHLWQDYAGGDGKHGLYAARGHVHICHLTPARNILAVFCGWLDKLVAGRCRSSHQTPCIACEPMPAELPSPAQEPLGVPFLLPMPIPAPEPSVLRGAPEEPGEDVSPQSAPSRRPAVVADPMPQPPLDPEGLKSARPGVVELAPDFVFPKDQATPAVPRNRIPARSAPPRNTIPTQ